MMSHDEVRERVKRIHEREWRETLTAATDEAWNMIPMRVPWTVAWHLAGKITEEILGLYRERRGARGYTVHDAANLWIFLNQGRKP